VLYFPEEGYRVRIFVVKGFARFQRRERLANEALCEAVDRAERGLIDADLGAGLIKQRVGRPGQGRRGGFRTLLAYRAGSRVVFLLGFAKNERDNIDADELAVLRARAQAFLDLGDAAIKARIADDDMTEVRCGAGEEQE